MAGWVVRQPLAAPMLAYASPSVGRSGTGVACLTPCGTHLLGGLRPWPGWFPLGEAELIGPNGSEATLRG